MGGTKGGLAVVVRGGMKGGLAVGGGSGFGAP